MGRAPFPVCTGWLLTVLLLLAPAAVSAAGSGPVARDHVEVELISEVDSIQPGQPFRVGLTIEHAPEWHTYWRNPGDSGLETRLEWQLPSGFQAGEIEWPWPERQPIEHLANYGYSGSLLLPVVIEAPKEIEPDEVQLTVRADWLVCRIECIPGSAELSLTLPVRQTPPMPAPEARRFRETDARIPARANWPTVFATESGQLSVQVRGAAELDPQHLDLFVAEPMLVAHADPPVAAGTADTLQFSQKLSPFFRTQPDALELVIVDREAQRAWQVSAQPGSLTSDGPRTSTASTSTRPLALLLLMALAGGLLLNLMPCVFPVLSLKALSLAGAGDARKAHALAYTAGVLLSFALLAMLLLGLRAAGESIGWGFQLQSPMLVGLLACLLFGMGLSLSGLIDFGGRWTGLGQALTEKPGLSGSFFTGVLATLVASPCTAPFMGTALGLAVLLPFSQALSVFLALGLGLALPLAVIGLIPQVAGALPKPGPWMQTFRQLTAFPIYLTVVWLLWVLARQTGTDGIALALAGLVALAFALWLAGRPGWRRTEALRHVLVAAMLVVTVATIAAAARQSATAGPDPESWWEPWSRERLNELRADPAHSVFVNMTADWCVTCLVNERVALNTGTVKEAFENSDAVYLKGDWTRRDPEITRYLAEFDRNGVPLYVFYPAAGGEPRVLPQILTPATLLDILSSD